MQNFSYAGLFRPTSRRQALLYDISLVFGASVFIALSAQFAFSVPFSPVPVTLQTFAVLLMSAFLGHRLGTLAVLTYLLEGSIGLPVFAQAHGGFVHLFGATGGYLIGFIPAAYVTGLLADRFKNRPVAWVFLIMTVGTAIIFACGLSWLALVFKGSDLFVMGLYPFVPGAILKIFAATLIFATGGKIISRFTK